MRQLPHFHKEEAFARIETQQYFFKNPVLQTGEYCRMFDANKGSTVICTIAQLPESTDPFEALRSGDPLMPY
jgi:hypothetical protein